MSSVIKIENLHYTYPGDEFESLKGVSFEIERGSFVAILGHNGSGKSTFAKLLNMILEPTAGKLVIDGVKPNAAHLKLAELEQNQFLHGGYSLSIIH